MSGELYKITPLDTLFFRDGRPFVAGEGTDAFSLFPPSPFTVQGLIRSQLLAKGCKAGWSQYKTGCGTCGLANQCDVKDAVGSLDQKYDSKLRIRGPWIFVKYKDSNKSEKETVLFPCPADLVGLSDDLKTVRTSNKGTFITETLSPSLDVGDCNLPGKLRRLVPSKNWEGKEFEGVGGWLSWEVFKGYLRGNSPQLTVKETWWRPSDLWEIELRPGLEVKDDRNHAEEGRLYFARHVRLDHLDPKVEMLVDLANLGPTASTWNNFPITPFGGERRSVALEKSSLAFSWSSIDSQVEAKIKNSLKVKLVLTQMAWFEEGWRRKTWNPDTTAGEFNGANCTWLAAKMERPQTIGGWNLASGEQKPIRRFVPTGSVYYLSNPDKLDLILDGWGSCITETPDEDKNPINYKALGLGQVFLGTW